MLSLLWPPSIRSNPTVRDNRLDLIGLWIYPYLMVGCLHVTSLLSSESAMLADSPCIKNILAFIYCTYYCLDL